MFHFEQTKRNERWGRHSIHRSEDVMHRFYLLSKMNKKIEQNRTTMTRRRRRHWWIGLKRERGKFLDLKMDRMLELPEKSFNSRIYIAHCCGQRWKNGSEWSSLIGHRTFTLEIRFAIGKSHRNQLFQLNSIALIGRRVLERTRDRGAVRWTKRVFSYNILIRHHI